MLTLAELNSAPADRFVELVGLVFGGHVPGMAQRTQSARPFRTFEALYRATVYALESASRDEQLALIQMQPALSGRLAQTRASTHIAQPGAVQLGFTTLQDAEAQRFAELEQRYREKFGFPCLVALQRHLSRDTVRVEIERRLRNDSETEIMYAMQQMGHIVQGRLEQLLRTGK